MSTHNTRRGSALLIAVALLTTSGCATIPEEAKYHATALKTYAQKTTQGTLAAYDAVCSSYRTVGQRLIDQLNGLGGEYVANMGEAGTRSGQAADRAGALASKADGLAKAAPTVTAADVQALATELANVVADLKALEGDCKAVVASTRTKLKLVAGYPKGLDAQLANTKDLRLMIEQSMLTLEEGIELHRSLFESYERVRLSRNAFLGAQLTKSYEQAQDQANEALGKGASIASDVTDKTSLIP